MEEDYSCADDDKHREEREKRTRRKNGGSCVIASRQRQREEYLTVIAEEGSLSFSFPLRVSSSSPDTAHAQLYISFIAENIFSLLSTPRSTVSLPSPSPLFQIFTSHRCKS